MVCGLGRGDIHSVYSRRKRVDDEDTTEEGGGEEESWSKVTIHLLPSCDNCQHRAPRWLTHNFCRYGMRPPVYQHGSDMWVKLDEIAPCGYYEFRIIGEPRRHSYKLR